MNKTIRTRSGLITGGVVLLYVLLLRLMGVPDNSPWVLIQFALVMLGLIGSCFWLYRQYAGIRFIEALTHCTRTLATAIVVILLGFTLIYWTSQGNTSFTGYNFMLMKVLFSFAASGLLSAFFTSYIFYTFTRNKAS
jgi:hypothetical protein